jgi:hypothetical protein
MRHELKAWPERFEKILANKHMAELRINDREYAPGDEILMKEWTHDNRYTAREVLVRVEAVNKPPWPPANPVIQEIIEKEYKVHHASSMRMRGKPIPEVPDFVVIEISLISKEEGDAR